jgi:hypothetical protein
MILQTSKVGLGNFQTGSGPLATLHVTSKNTTDDLVRLSSSSGQPLTNVAPDGTISLYSAGAIVGTITPTPDGVSIDLSGGGGTLNINGNLNVTSGIITGRMNNVLNNPSPPPKNPFTNYSVQQVCTSYGYAPAPSPALST